MSQRFHITVFDKFQNCDADEHHAREDFASVEAAIAAVKIRIEAELAHFWSELLKRERATLEALIRQYETYAAMPVAFDAKGDAIFDSQEYMKLRAAEIAAHSPSCETSRPEGGRCSTD